MSNREVNLVVSKRLAIVAAVLALLGSLAMMPIAHANGSTSTGTKPQLGPIGSKHLHVVGPNSYYCDPSWIYDNVSDKGRQLIPTTVVYGDYNGTANNATASFSAITAGTVTLTSSIGGSVDASAIIAGVNYTFGISVSVSLYASVGNTISITVPPYKTGFGQHGVWRKIAYGHYYYLASNCHISTDDGYITSYSPWYVGWNTWIG